MVHTPSHPASCRTRPQASRLAVLTPIESTPADDRAAPETSHENPPAPARLHRSTPPTTPFATPPKRTLLHTRAAPTPPGPPPHPRTTNLTASPSCSSTSTVRQSRSCVHKTTTTIRAVPQCNKGRDRS